MCRRPGREKSPFAAVIPSRVPLLTHTLFYTYTTQHQKMFRKRFWTGGPDPIHAAHALRPHAARTTPVTQTPVQSVAATAARPTAMIQENRFETYGLPASFIKNMKVNRFHFFPSVTRLRTWTPVYRVRIIETVKPQTYNVNSTRRRRVHSRCKRADGTKYKMIHNEWRRRVARVLGALSFPAFCVRYSLEIRTCKSSNRISYTLWIFFL